MCIFQSVQTDTITTLRGMSSSHEIEGKEMAGLSRRCWMGPGSLAAYFPESSLIYSLLTSGDHGREKQSTRIQTSPLGEQHPWAPAQATLPLGIIFSSAYCSDWFRHLYFA